MNHLVDLTAPHRHLERPGPTELARGRVVMAPAGIRAPMRVQVLGESSEHAYLIPGSNWMPRIAGPTGGGGGDADYVAELPQVGMVCLVVLDNFKDAWVPVWG